MSISGPTLSSDNVAIYVMSCDKTVDIAEHFLAAFAKYWPNCPYRIFFGVNSIKTHVDRISAISLPSNSGNWKTESIQQLNYIKKNYGHIKYLLVFLDDFIINKYISNSEIDCAIRVASKNKLKYLRFRSLDECLVGRLWYKIKVAICKCQYFEIRRSHPYYSSLQVALWDIEHISNMLNSTSDIWEFEKLRIFDVNHFSLPRSIISYKHVVEKGCWDIDAEWWCKKSIGFFNPGERERRRISPFSRVKIKIKWVFFELFGYAPTRLKNYLFYRGVI